jgi:hypothetical protein
VVHLPDADLGRDDDSVENGDQPAAVKKPTRRGSRGGRNRRKRPAGATAGSTASTNGETPETTGTAVSEPVAETSAPVAKAPAASREKTDDSETWEYTPMSQWDDVDEKAS